MIIRYAIGCFVGMRMDNRDTVYYMNMGKRYQATYIQPENSGQYESDVWS